MTIHRRVGPRWGALLAGSIAWACLHPISAPRADAATYHVDGANPLASDSNPGTSAAPYRTINAALARGGPGVTIAIHPAVYREQVSIGSSGTAGNPLVVRAVAPGARIDGSDDFSTPAAWTLVGGNVWLAASVMWSPRQVFLDGLRLTASNATVSSLPLNTFRHVSGVGLHVNAGGANPGTHVLQVGRRSYGVRISARSWVTLDGFDVTHTEDRGIYVTSSCSNLAIVRNTVSFCYRYGVGISGGSAIAVASNLVSDNADHGIYLSSGVTGCVVEDNDVTRSARPGNQPADGIHVSGCVGVRIERNRLHENRGAGLRLGSASNDAVCVQNLAWKNGQHGFQVSASTGARLVGDVAWGNTRRGISLEGTSTGAAIFDCIAVDNGIAAADYDLAVASTAAPGLASNDNLFWNSTARAPVLWGSIAYASLAAFGAATGQDLRSIQAEPRFVDPSRGDFRLAAGSPAIDSGNSSVPHWPALDLDQRPRQDDPTTPNSGLGPVPFADRGAHEFVPPASVTTAALSVTPAAGADPLTVTADASGSRAADGGALAYRFEFGDGTVVGPQSQASATHVFGLGVWTLTVTVTDATQDSASASALVTVTDLNAAPVASLVVTGPAGIRLVVNPDLVIGTAPQALPDHLAPVVDPAFGTPVTRVTGNTGAAFTIGGGGTGTWGSDARHHYSKDQPWNVDGTLLMLQNSDTPEALLLDGNSYQVLAGPCPTYPRGDDRWHPSALHPRERINVTESELMWFDVVGCVKTRSWILPFPVNDLGMGEGNPSADGRFVALADSQRVFVADMDPQPPFAPYPAQRIGPAFDLSNCGLPNCAVGWVSVSPSGRYVVVKYSQDHPRVLDLDPNTLTLTPHGYPGTITRCAGDPGQGFVYDLGHSDMALDPFDGNEDVLVGQEHCGFDGTTVGGQLIGNLVMVRLRDGALTSLTDPANEATAHHVSTRNMERPGWAYVSYKAQPGRRFSDEIVAVKLDGSRSVERLAHKHSVYDNCYRCESHAVPSRDGRRVLWASNWALDCTTCGAPTDIKAYVVDARAAAGPSGYTWTVEADASASRDPDGSVASYRFDFGDGTVIGPQTSSRAAHAYHEGQWIARVIVTDDRGASDSTTVPVSVVAPNGPPHGSIDTPPSNLTIEAGGSVHFSATGLDPENDLPLTYGWSFGGGPPNSAVEDPGPVTFASAGIYLVTLSVADSRTAADPTPESRIVTVTAPPGGPNLVGNPSFETGTTGWNASGSATIARVPGGYDGGFCVEVRATGSGGFGLNDSPSWVTSTAAAGTPYRLMAWVRSAANAGRAKFKLREYRAGTQVGTTAYSTPVTLSPTWQSVTLNYVAQGAGNNLDFQVLDDPVTAGETFQIDLVSVVVSPANAPAGASAGAGDDAPGGADAAPGPFVPATPLVGAIAPHPISDLGILRFRTTRAGALRVRLYDTHGRSVRLLLADPEAAAGVHSVTIRTHQAGTRLAPGVYFYRIDAAEGESTGRLLILE